VGDRSAIEWTEATWNPIRGCSRVSEGCRHCYAERVAARFSGPGKPYEDLAQMTPAGPRWTGAVRLVESVLDQPLRWRKPRRIFVNSMSDLFHESVSNDTIAAIFGAMAACPDHVFQVLTKRATRLPEWFGWIADMPEGPTGRCGVELQDKIGIVGMGHRWRQIEEAKWPLPHVHLGVSIEDQATADERIPLLLQTPAAVRWVSYEPALGPVEFRSWLRVEGMAGHCYDIDGDAWHLPGTCKEMHDCCRSRLDWIVVGGESGPGARPFDLAWARSTIAQCRAAGVPVFVKQLGRNITWDVDVTAGNYQRTRFPDSVIDRRDLEKRPDGSFRIYLTDRKGGDVAEWPADLRVREWPR
jgi:protein gp37